MTTPPQDDQSPDRVQTPSISTAPTSGETAPAGPRWWHWGAVPHHLGRARTSTVVLAVLFLAVFALYLNVRPDVASTGTTPAGGSSDVEAPVNPLVPSEPAAPETTGEPAPTTEPEETPSEDTGTPTTSSTTSSPDTGSPQPTTAPSTPTGTSEPASPTDGTTEPSTSSPAPTG